MKKQNVRKEIKKTIARLFTFNRLNKAKEDLKETLKPKESKKILKKPIKK